MLRGEPVPRRATGVVDAIRSAAGVLHARQIRVGSAGALVLRLFCATTVQCESGLGTSVENVLSLVCVAL